MKRLVLAEKPSVGRDIARVLGCKKETHSYIEGNDYIVTWALGHLVSLADPEQYGKEYKEWNMDVLPMMPKHWKLTVLKKTSKQFQTVKKLLLRNDIKDVIIATDAGREGELVARWILQMSGNKKPIYRLWISSVTDKAIKDGFAHLKQGKEYDNLFRAARSRAEADWLVGINATRALTCKYNAQLSCGRVQTPTLAMIMNREQEIRNFKPQKYYGYKIFATGMNFTWENQKGNQRISDKKWAEELGKKLRGHDLVITEVSKKEKKNYAPELYDLTTLQKEASKRYGFSPKQTLNIMQSLYEHHKVLTYPRTDSRYLTNDMTETLKDRIKACQNGSYKKAAAALSKQLAEGALNKHYYAVLCGYPDCPEGDLVDYLRKEGNVAVAVTGREQEFADAKIAALHYRILEEINDPSPLALADVTIGTGRFHQIRVQFAHAGFPLLGDTKYGMAALKEAMPAQKYRGVALCAYSLELVHPVSGKKMGFRVVPKNPAFAGFAMEELKKLTENETGISKRG